VALVTPVDAYQTQREDADTVALIVVTHGPMRAPEVVRWFDRASRARVKHRVSVILSELARDGRIDRLDRGLYDRPSRKGPS
jgi:hypothetical protein